MVRKFETIQEMFDFTVKEFPDNRCFTRFGTNKLELNYQEASNYINNVASFLIDKDIKPGDSVGLTGKNSPEWAITFLSILKAGGVVIPVDNALDFDKKQQLFNKARCKIVFDDSGEFTKEYENYLLSDKAENYILNLNGNNRDYPKIDVDMNAAILFTSGTTGNEKGVMLTHRNFVYDVFAAQNYMTLYPTDVFYALLPIHHSYCMNAVFLQGISVGAEIVFASGLAIKQILAELKEGKVTMFLGIPLLFNKLLAGILKGVKEKGIIVYGIIRFLMSISGFIKKVTGRNPGKKIFKSILKKVSLDTNRICISGGGPLPAETFKMFNQLGIDFVQGYGLTETSPIICLNPIYAYKEYSVGKVLPGCNMIIVDRDKRGIGEIAVKGDMVFKGYFENEEATKEAFNEDHYFLTGDLGYLDNENYLVLTGRKKSLIVTEGGKNVYPEEIEDKFQLFEGIEQVLVQGYKEGNGERIGILFYPNQEFLEEQGEDNVAGIFNSYVDEVNKSLLAYQHIDRVKILKDPMEMTTTKKIKRHLIK